MAQQVDLGTALRILLYALAVFRITHLLWYENGPFDVIDLIRAKAGVGYIMMDGKRVRYADNVLGKMFNCPWCLSGWVALVAVVAYLQYNAGLDIAVLWFAIWALAMLPFGTHKYTKQEMPE